jgi:hypothetical protein
MVKTKLFVLQCHMPGDEPEIRLFTTLDLAIDFATKELMKCDGLLQEEVVVFTGTAASDRYNTSVLAGIMSLESSQEDEDEDIIEYTVSEYEVDPTE